MTVVELTRSPLVKSLARSRWPQLIAALVALGGFVFAIVAGLYGTPVGSHNFAIVGVWIAWWALLVLAAVPLGGRVWCSVCPLPMPGEWLQRGAVLGPRPEAPHPRRRWPNRLRNIWLQNAAFVLVALFSAVVLTQPRATALALAGFVVAAIVTSLTFERRAFCRYLCPVGGFIGLYSQLAPLEVRVRDTAVCAGHREKTCYVGSAAGYGCPWQVYPGALRKNTYCGMCLECLRTCPYDNVVINLRPAGADLAEATGRRLDEAYKAFILLGSATVYSAVMLGPWGVLKSAAYSIGSPEWLAYAVGFAVVVLGLLPGAFFAAVAAGRSWAHAREPLRQAGVALAYSLIPLGMAAWIAFSLSFVFANLSYLWPAVSDPLGWGWNLLGTVGAPWTPYLGEWVPFLQSGVLILGLLWSAISARRIAGERLPVGAAQRLALPVVAFSLAVTIGLLVLQVG